MHDFIWPIATLGAFCFGITAGIAWAAQWRPARIEIVLNQTIERESAE